MVFGRNFSRHNQVPRGTYKPLPSASSASSVNSPAGTLVMMKHRVGRKSTVVPYSNTASLPRSSRHVSMDWTAGQAVAAGLLVIAIIRQLHEKSGHADVPLHIAQCKPITPDGPIDTGCLSV